MSFQRSARETSNRLLSHHGCPRADCGRRRARGCANGTASHASPRPACARARTRHRADGAPQPGRPDLTLRPHRSGRRKIRESLGSTESAATDIWGAGTGWQRQQSHPETHSAVRVSPRVKKDKSRTTITSEGTCISHAGSTPSSVHAWLPSPPGPAHSSPDLRPRPGRRGSLSPHSGRRRPPEPQLRPDPTAQHPRLAPARPGQAPGCNAEQDAQSFVRSRTSAHLRAARAAAARHLRPRRPGAQPPRAAPL